MQGKGNLYRNVNSDVVFTAFLKLENIQCIVTLLCYYIDIGVILIFCFNMVNMHFFLDKISY